MTFAEMAVVIVAGLALVALVVVAMVATGDFRPRTDRRDGVEKRGDEYMIWLDGRAYTLRFNGYSYDIHTYPEGRQLYESDLTARIISSVDGYKQRLEHAHRLERWSERESMSKVLR